MLEEFLKSISIVFYEALCCKIFLDIFLKRRFASKWERILSMVVLTSAMLFLALFTQLNNRYIMRGISMIACFFGFSFVFYLGGWQKKLFVSAAFYVLLYCVDYVSYILLSTFVDDRYLDNDVLQVLIVLLCKTVLFVIVLVIEHFWNRGRSVQMEGPAWILMLCFPVLSLAIMLVMLFSFLGTNSSSGYLMIAFGVMFMNFVMFGWLKFISERDRQWKQVQLIQERNGERLQLYQEMKINYEEQRGVLHDYRSQLGCIQGLLENKQYREAKAYIEKLTDSFPDSMQHVDVNHSILNVVLNQKYRLAEREGILISLYANDLSDLWLEEQDVVSLLSNLLDNAIEACEKLRDEKKIWIKLVREKRQFVISVRNPVLAPVDIQDGKIPTSKENKGKHGIGLKNIQMILEKYDGMGMMRYEDGYFSYTAVIPEIKA